MWTQMTDTTPPADSPAGPPTHRPDVTAVIATRNRPELLRRALASIAASDFNGTIETIVVFDQSDPDHSVVSANPKRRVRVMRNARTTGLAGGRNTGATEATGKWLAFCDDDDEWMPEKVTAQIAALEASPEARLATCGVAIRFDDEDHIRIPDETKLTFDGFLDDRMTEVHPSSFLFDRDWFVDELGMVDEELPGSYAEDYDVLLRTAKLAQIVSVPEAYIRVWWHPSTYFRDRWSMIDEALGYLTNKFPEFNDAPKGLARIRGQQAFARAAAGDRSGAFSAVRETVKLRPLEPRSYVALGVAAGLPANKVLETLHRFGRGI